MWLRKIIFTIFIFQIVSGQTIYNALGLGTDNTIGNASAYAVGSTGLLPAYASGLSLDNPSTWVNSSFSLFSGAFGGEQISGGQADGNGGSELAQIKIILPVKGKYSYGLEISPLTNSNYSLFDQESVYYTESPGYTDTLTTVRSIEGAGGLSTFKLSFGIRNTEYENSGVTLQLLFGSARHLNNLSVDGTDYINSRHDYYSGLAMHYYLSTNRFKLADKNTSLYLSFGFTLQPLTVSSTQYHLYEDSNGNGFYETSYDFPYLTSSQSRSDVKFKSVRKPFTLELGYDLELQPRLHLMGEYYYTSMNNKTFGSQSPIVDSEYNSVMHINFGAVKFSRRIPREWYQWFHYRAGIYYENRDIEKFEGNLSETGLSMGLGFKFGPTNNQIDLTYATGVRKGPLTETNERIERFRIQLTLGDIWFVKRRAR